MNSDKLIAAWSAQQASPDPALQAALIGQIQRTLAARSSQQRRMLAFAAVMLLIPLLATALDYLTGQADTINLAKEWGLVPFVLIPFAALFFIAWREPPATSNPRESFLEAFKALRAENAAAIGRIKIVSASIVVFAPFLPVMLNQLVLVGKMREHEMHSALLVLGGGLLCGLGWMAVKYLAWLRPERGRLEALIAQYE